jgi:hypothetical protein
MCVPDTPIAVDYVRLDQMAVRVGRREGALRLGIGIRVGDKGRQLVRVLYSSVDSQNRPLIDTSKPAINRS